MREGQFIRQNIHKWKSYQETPTSDPDEMASRFIELVDDLGYAKTFYPQSRMTVFLNKLASGIYLDIYKNRKEKSSRIFKFWKTDLPLIARKYRREILYSFLFFTIVAILAAFSAAHDEHFVRGVMGDRYVDMTEQNISKGDPFGVYKSQNRMEMFLEIAVNNVRVSFIIFVSGLLCGAGTIYFLFQNGVMLGAFQYYFFSKGLGWKSVLVIWLHGTLEISAIIIAGAAGIILGKGILFPGTYKRVDSLKRAARDGIKLMIGLIPIFITAAFLEGFVTRLTKMPVWLSSSILLMSAALIVWYFIIYPIRVEREIKRSASEIS